jgi:hypothetical protein
MRTMFRTLAAASCAALLIGASATPSAAIGAWHGGGGWHGGGWGHGGGWRGGGWHGGRWGGGRWGWGPAVGLGVAGGLIAGSALAYPYYGGYYNGCVQYQPAYDAYGNYVGTQAVNVC